MVHENTMLNKYILRQNDATKLRNNAEILLIYPGFTIFLFTLYHNTNIYLKYGSISG